MFIIPPHSSTTPLIPHESTLNTPTGHAIIQVDAQGNNAIVIHGGANQQISKEILNLEVEYSQLPVII